MEFLSVSTFRYIMLQDLGRHDHAMGAALHLVMRSAQAHSGPSRCMPLCQVTYNILIDVYVKRCQWEEAVKILDILEKQVR